MFSALRRLEHSDVDTVISTEGAPGTLFFAIDGDGGLRAWLEADAAEVSEALGTAVWMLDGGSSSADETWLRRFEGGRAVPAEPPPDFAEALQRWADFGGLGALQGNRCGFDGTLESPPPAASPKPSPPPALDPELAEMWQKASSWDLIPAATHPDVEQRLQALTETLASEEDPYRRLVLEAQIGLCQRQLDQPVASHVVQQLHPFRGTRALGWMLDVLEHERPLLDHLRACAMTCRPSFRFLARADLAFALARAADPAARQHLQALHQDIDALTMAYLAPVETALMKIIANDPPLDPDELAGGELLWPLVEVMKQPKWVCWMSHPPACQVLMKAKKPWAGPVYVGVAQLLHDPWRFGFVTRDRQLAMRRTLIGFVQKRKRWLLGAVITDELREKAGSIPDLKRQLGDRI